MENPENPPTPKLTVDLITEILIRLPAKPLHRFKTVSNSWNSLISSRPFLRRYITFASKSFPTLHLARFHTPTLDTLHLPSLESSSPTSPSPLTPLSLPFTPVTQYSHVFGSTHGLLGISDYPKFISLYNPTNNTCHVIKTPALQPHVEAHWVDFGLGFDSLSDDYKIVMINQLNGPLPSPPEVRVYNVKKDPIWRKLNLTFPHYLAFPRTYTHAKYLPNSNSLLYICAVNPPRAYDSTTAVRDYSQLENNYRLVDFNLSTETFSVSLFPEFDHNGRYYGSQKEGYQVPIPFMTVSKTDLICQVMYGPAEGRVIDMWVKREGESEWVKMFRFGIEVDGPKFGVKGYARPVVVSSDGAELLMEGDLCTYFWYKVKSGEVRKVVFEDGMAANYQEFGGFPHQTRGVVYHESFVVLGNCGLEIAEEDEDDGKGVMIMKPGVGSLKMNMAEYRRYLQGQSSASIFSGVD